MRAMNDAGPPGRAARELDRGLDGLSTGISEEHLVQIWDMFQQPFGEHARECGNVELHKIWQVGVEHTFQGMAQRRVIPAYRKNAKSAQ